MFPPTMPRSFQLARQLREFLGVGPMALTGVGARIASGQKSTLQLGEVGHVVAQEEVVHIWRPPIIVEQIQLMAINMRTLMTIIMKILSKHHRTTENISTGYQQAVDSAYHGVNKQLTVHIMESTSS